MKTPRFPIPVSHCRAPYSCSRRLACLLLLVIYAAGFFTGALLFGEALLTLHAS